MLGPLASLSVWLVLAAIAWLDTDGCAWSLRPGLELHGAHIFSLIWAGITALAGLLSSAAEVTVAYLASAISYLASHVALILRSTGAMFAKVWDAAKIVWSDVLRPFVQWVDRIITKFQAWLKSTLQPVFDWLKRIREYLNDIYKRFVRPVIDTIEFLRGLNRVLLAFHIKWLQQLDVVLQRIEQRIEEPLEWVSAEFNRVWDTFNLVIDIDGFYQRYTLARSMSRYAPDWVKTFWNRQAIGLTKGEAAALAARKYDKFSATWNGEQLAGVLRGEDNEISGYVAELVPLFKEASNTNRPSVA